MNNVVLNLQVNIEKCRLALVGNGYLLDEVYEMSEKQIIHIWADRFSRIIEESYNKCIRLGLHKDMQYYNPTPYEKGTTDLIEKGWKMKEERKAWED